MTRYFIEVMYNGTAFHGSQVQGDLSTVQLELNKALQTLLRAPVETLGASRTDEGVHALSNFYHIDTEHTLNSKSVYSLNAILPVPVSIRQIYVAPADCNARFAATERHYRYRVYFKKNPFLHERALHFPFPIDREVLDQAAAMLQEYTDFETFSKRNTQSKTFQCTLFASRWETQGDELHYVVQGNRFLRGMVRGLVGTQLRAARGKFSLDTFRQIIESKDCSNADFSVPGFGLYLEKVVYPEGFLLPV
jgi:tRNA pseudouridine38-40 synthase